MKKHSLLLVAFLVIQFHGLANEITVPIVETNDACATLTLTSGAGTIAQTLCTNSAITTISYSVGNGGTGAIISAGSLPPGVTATFSGSTFTISGIAIESGVYNFEVSTIGGDCPATLNGFITVVPDVTVSLASAPPTANQTVCINTPILSIVYVASNSATGSTATGLPAGVTGDFNNGVFTISGTPTATGNYTYTVQTSGGCGISTLVGNITVVPNTSVSLVSALGTGSQFVCENYPIVNIVYAIASGGTGATVSGLPPGVTADFATGMLTISGTPTVAGTFPYTVHTIGGCSSAMVSGTITVGPEANLNIICGDAIANGLNFDWNFLAGATGYNYSYVIGSGPEVSGTSNVTNFTVPGISTGQSVTFTIATVNGTVSCFVPQTLTCLAQPLASQQFDKHSFAYFPNPVQDILHLQYEVNFERIEIFDVIGKKVFEKTTKSGELQLDLSALHSGVYLVNATTANGNQIFKIVKE